MTCVVRVLVLAQGPSFLRLRRALLGRRGDSQVERKATITSGKVKTIWTKCFTFTKEIRSGLEARPLQVSLANQGVEYDLIAQEVKSAEYRRRMSSTYTTRVCTRGMVLHMLGGLVACTKVQWYIRWQQGDAGMKGAQRVHISRY